MQSALQIAFDCGLMDLMSHIKDIVALLMVDDETATFVQTFMQVHMYIYCNYRC